MSDIAPKRLLRRVKTHSTLLTNSFKALLSACVFTVFLANLAEYFPVSHSVIVVTPTRFLSSQGTLYIMENREKAWRVIDSFPVRLGEGGVSLLGYSIAAWGKREGDQKTPNGIYTMSEVFWQSWHAKVQLKGMLGHEINQQSYFVDDSFDVTYNHWQQSFKARGESMVSYPLQYQQGIVVDYNRNPALPWFGSAIFIHVWKNKSHATAGCIAMHQDNLNRLFNWLAIQNVRSKLVIRRL